MPQREQPSVPPSGPQPVSPVVSKTRSSNSAKLPLLILLFLILLAAAGYGVYAWQHQKLSSANTKIAALQSQLATEQSATSKAASTVNVPQFFDFKQLGVKFIPDQTLAGLHYIIYPPSSSDQGGAYLADTATDAAYNQCQIDSISPSTTGVSAAESSFASISKVKGTYSATTKGATAGQLIKQFNGFYIVINYPNGQTCQGNKTDQNNWIQVSHSAAVDFQKTLINTITLD